MRLEVITDDQTRIVEVPDLVLNEGEEFFAGMDRDMDNGWQMSRQWVEHPGQTERCQIAADRLMLALESGNEQIAALMAGYILARLPGVAAVRIDTSGDMLGTEFVTAG